LTFGRSDAQDLDQYGGEPFEQQQFGKAGVEGVNLLFLETNVG